MQWNCQEISIKKQKPLKFITKVKPQITFKQEILVPVQWKLSIKHNNGFF